MELDFKNSAQQSESYPDEVLDKHSILKFLFFNSSVDKNICLRILFFI